MLQQESINDSWSEHNSMVSVFEILSKTFVLRKEKASFEFREFQSNYKDDYIMTYLCVYVAFNVFDCR